MKTLYIILGILYLLFPRDLIPDFLVGWGWLDDLFVLGLLFRYLYKQKKQQQAARAQHQYFYQNQRNRQEAGEQAGADRTEHHDRPRSPYEILGVDPTASLEDIKKAYRSLAGKYHPDKVAHLGDEFRRMAEQRFKEIQQAYQEIRDSKQ
jgi:DnaJ like chaperone protein